MLYASESQQLLERFATELEDIRTIARMHSLPIGNPERLAALPLRLAQDSRLRSDLTETIRSLQARDPELGLPEALELVLVAIAGPAALDRNRDLEEAVDLTGGFLASLGGWPGSDVEPLIDIDNPPDHDPRLDLAAVAATEDPVSSSPIQLGSEPTVDEAATAHPASTAPDDETLAVITHALARLERGNLELRLHLDSIDQRISRMEPLLESVPHVTHDGSEPEPPDTPGQGPRSAAPVDLLHRGAPSDSPRSRAPEPRDALDEVKELRRISLTSNFAAGAPLDSGVRPAIPSRAVLHPADPQVAAIPGQLNDPVSHPRMARRRDRFAAARELPGVPADSDPLYTAPEPEPAKPETVAAPAAADPLPAPASLPPSAPAIASTARSVPVATPHEISPAPASIQPQAPPEQPPAPTMQPQASPVQPVAAAAVDPPRLHTPERPSSTPSLFSSLAPAASRAAESDEASPRRFPWVAGVAAAAVLGAAGFLYLNGLPSFLAEWVGGSANNASVSTDNTRSAEPSAAESTPPAASSSVPEPSHHTRVLGARESFTPTESIERTNGPTFVPGSTMDGYLISAPRPVYPELARLVGAQGKISFEAMISKQGQVEAVKVLGGPQVLRAAATDAVRQWQYRPFEVKGRPVEVRTIIRVDVASHSSAPATP